MSRRFLGLIGFSLVILLSFGLTSQLSAAQKKEKPAKAEKKKEKMDQEDRLTGSVQMINKDTSVVTIRKGNITRQVVYNADTKFTYRNKPGSLDDVKEGRRVICLGKFDDKTRLVATRIDVREGK